MRKKHLDICFVAPQPPPFGGIGQWLMLLCSHLREKTDIRFHIVNTSPKWGRRGYDYTRWKRILRGGLELAVEVCMLLGTLLVNRCTLIHLTTSARLGLFRDLCVMGLARIISVPVVYHIHFGRIPELAHSRTLEWRLLSLALQHASAVVVIDSASEQALKEFLPKVPVTYIPNCIDLTRSPVAHHNGSSSRTVLYLGWMVPAKGIEELIRAWAHLDAAEWHLTIAGPGEAQYVQSLLNTYLPKQVTFLGELSHVEAMEQLAQADLFVLPSHTEGFPNVLLEAMSLSKPIIASSVGAIPEILADDCGVLVPARNTEALERELRRVLTNPECCAGMGTRARMRVMTKYTIDEVFAQYLAVWQRVVDGRSALKYQMQSLPGDHAYLQSAADYPFAAFTKYH